MTKRQQDIGQRILKARLAQGMSQTELANRLGIKPQAVQHWERGTAKPKTNRIHEIADALEIPVAWLLSDYDTGLKSQPIHPPITTDELLLISQYRKMDEQRQQIFEEIVRALANPDHRINQPNSSGPKMK